MHELDRVNHTSPQVNRLLEITRNMNSGTPRGMNSGYNVLRSGQPTSLPRYSGAAVQHGGEFSPVGNIQNDLVSMNVRTPRTNKYRKEPQHTPIIGDKVRLNNGLFYTNSSSIKHDNATGREVDMSYGYRPQRNPEFLQL